MRRVAPPPRGIVAREAYQGTLAHQRLLPAPALAPYVAHVWSVRWDLARTFTAETLPHPSVHLIVEDGRGELVGVSTARFTRVLRGRGEVLAIKFRPAAFQPLVGGSLARLTDRVVPVARVLGAPGGALVAALAGPGPIEARIAAAEAVLLPAVPPLPAEVAALRDLVERMAIDRTIRRVDDAAARIGLDVRTLQRRFARHVGVSPKWVIQRYRLHEAAERLRARCPPSLADVAAELGYADQAHFARDFARTVGVSPSVFVRRRG